MLKFIDLFAGLGGFRIAFQSLKCKCVYSCEIDKEVATTYFENFNDDPLGDITKVNEKDIPYHDILCAGFPCQSFSIAGKRLGFEDSRGTMFFEVARIVKEKMPKAIFLENVKGITNHDKGQTLKVILDSLEKLGYNVFWKILNAKDYGVPQNRERWYCVCFRKDLKINHFDFPNKIPLKKKITDIFDSKNDELVRYKCSKTCTDNINYWLNRKEIDVTEKTIAYEIRKSKCQFISKSYAPCLTAKMGTGGNNVPVIVSKMRKLTENECLKLMGFPKTYYIKHGALAYKQIGNSVVIPIIKLIAKEIIKVIDDN